MSAMDEAIPSPGTKVAVIDDDKFIRYLEDRRRQPRDDVLTALATAKYPDGSTPEVIEVVRSATFLFAAGQETTARLLAAAMRQLTEHPELQDELREHKDKIPNFIEEALRVESPVKTDFRLTKKTTAVAGVEVKAGTPVMLLNGAANRDPGRFECPAEFRADRPNTMDHLAFGRGHHSCPGGPLARAEGRISIERILERMRDIRLFIKQNVFNAASNVMFGEGGAGTFSDGKLTWWKFFRTEEEAREALRR